MGRGRRGSTQIDRLKQSTFRQLTVSPAALTPSSAQQLPGGFHHNQNPPGEAFNLRPPSLSGCLWLLVPFIVVFSIELRILFFELFVKGFFSQPGEGAACGERRRRQVWPEKLIGLKE